VPAAAVFKLSSHHPMRRRSLSSLPDSQAAQYPIMANEVSHPLIINFTKIDIIHSYSGTIRPQPALSTNRVKHRQRISPESNLFFKEPALVLNP
jgi:hypothetical protein